MTNSTKTTMAAAITLPMPAPPGPGLTDVAPAALWYLNAILFQFLQIVERQYELVATANNERRNPVPAIYNLQVQIGGIFPQRLAANANRFRFATGFDHGCIRINLRTLLQVFRALRFLFLHHLGFDGVLQFLGQANVLNDNVFQQNQAAHLLLCERQSFAFDLLTRLHNLLRAL